VTADSVKCQSTSDQGGGAPLCKNTHFTADSVKNLCPESHQNTPF